MASQSQGVAKPVIWLVGIHGIALDSEELHVDILLATDVSLHPIFCLPAIVWDLGARSDSTLERV